VWVLLLHKLVQTVTVEVRVQYLQQHLQQVVVEVMLLLVEMEQALILLGVQPQQQDKTLAEHIGTLVEVLVLTKMVIVLLGEMAAVGREIEALTLVLEIMVLPIWALEVAEVILLSTVMAVQV
jgi:hypothetical protein